MLNTAVYLPGDAVFYSDIGPQPANSSDPGTTLVCVTTHINSAFCRASDNNCTTTDRAGAVGEWYYPNGSLVPCPDNVVDFARIGYTHQVRLAREQSDIIPQLGVYVCVVRDQSTGVSNNASIYIQRGK